MQFAFFFIFQAKMVNGVPSEKVSTLSFVDLAGTDRRHAKASKILYLLHVLLS